VLEGHDSEIKCVGFSPSGQYLATCSRDKSVWIWEEIGAEGEDEWETVAVLQEHEGDVKTVSWCADQGTEGGELLASASYDDTVRLWREDEEGEWGCVSVLKGHEGTVWGLDWEPLTKNDKGNVESEVISVKPARLLTSSADSTIRVWRKLPRVSHGTYAENNGIPSTMRPVGTGEQWVCEAVLPKVHDRAIYSISWSKKTRRVVSTGSDSRVVIYEERPKGPAVADANNIDGPVEVESDMQGLGGSGSETEWHVLCTLDQGHGPFEINHVTWCPRFDGGRKGDEEMVVTTGDDGQVRAWKLEE
jgi:WD40 repeat protein